MSVLLPFLIAFCVCYGVIGAWAYDRALLGQLSRTYPEPAWRVALRQVLIRAMPTCTLWVVDLYRDRVHLSFAPRWGILRRDIEDCPGLRPFALFSLPCRDGGSAHVDAADLALAILLCAVGLIGTAIMWATS